MKGNRKKTVECVVSSSKDPLPDEDVLQSLYAVCPDASFFSLIPPIFDEAPTKSTKPPPVDNFPRTLTGLYEEVNKSLSPEELLSKSESVFNFYRCTETQIRNLFLVTRSQTVSSLWYEHRKGRITASKAHEVLTLRPTTCPDKLVARIIGYKSYDLSKKEAIKWGLDNESLVRDAYSQNASQQHLNFSCQLSGLLISQSNHFLGASPDGLVECDCCGEGVLEIKCPHKHKDSTIIEASQTDKEFCLNSELHLKKTHKYYTQVQFQMFVTNRGYCDFVLMTCPNSEYQIVNVRVAKDQEFIDHLVNKCTSLTKEILIPELLTRNIMDKPADVKTDSSTLPKFCLCDEPEYGKMIFCDGDMCPIGWFHYPCVNIVRKPRGNWFCPNCKK